jgi:hypothetical protein
MPEKALKIFLPVGFPDARYPLQPSRGAFFAFLLGRTDYRNRSFSVVIAKKGEKLIQPVHNFVKAKADLEHSLMRTKDVAARFKVTRQSVMRWIDKGLLEPVANLPESGYLFDPKAVETFTPPPRGNPKHREKRQTR